MNSPTNPTGPPESADVVAVTGAAGYVGRRLLRQLARSGAFRRLVAIDLRPLPETYPGVVAVRRDVTEPLDDVFRQHGVGVVVHLAFVLRQLRDRRASRRVNIGGAESVLRASEAAGVRKLVLLSSSTVYGAHPDNPPALTEDAPERPPGSFHYAEDKVACEALFHRHVRSRPGVILSVLRSCVVMGPSAENFITAALFKPLLVGVRHQDPPLQFVHEDDLAAILGRFVAEEHPGTFNVAAPGTVRWSELARLAGRRMVWLPGPLASALVGTAWALRIQRDAPAVGLRWIRYPWLVSTARLEQELGHAFAHTSAGALTSFLDTSGVRTARIVD